MRLRNIFKKPSFMVSKRIRNTNVKLMINRESYRYHDKVLHTMSNYREYSESVYDRDIVIFNLLHHEKMHKLTNKERDMLLENHLDTHYPVYQNFSLFEISHNPKISNEIHENKKEPNLSFHEFMKFIETYFIQIIIDYLTKNPLGAHVLEGQSEIDIWIFLFDSSRSDTYSSHLDMISSSNTMVLTFSGAFLLGRGYLPYKYLDNFDKIQIKKEIDSLLELFMNTKSGVYTKEIQMRERYAALYNKSEIPYYGPVLVILEIFFGLFTYGKMTYFQNVKDKYFVYDKEKILRLMLLFMEISNKKGDEAKEMFENDFSPNSDTGEYYLGAYMWFIISLARDKQLNHKAQIKIGKDTKNINSIKIGELNSYLKIGNLWFIENIINTNTALFDEIRRESYQLSHFHNFIQLYFTSCRYLSMDPLIGRDFFKKLMNQAGAQKFFDQELTV